MDMSTYTKLTSDRWKIISIHVACPDLKFSTEIGEIANSNRGISLCESPRKMYPRGVISQDYVNVIKQLENEMAVKKYYYDCRITHQVPKNYIFT